MSVMLSVYQRKPVPHYLTLDPETMIVWEIVARPRKPGASLRFPIENINLNELSREEVLSRLEGHRCYHGLAENCTHLTQRHSILAAFFNRLTDGKLRE